MFETLIVLGIVAVIAYSVYRAGKRTGSRDGFYAGRRRGRRHRSDPRWRRRR